MASTSSFWFQLNRHIRLSAKFETPRRGNVCNVINLINLMTMYVKYFLRILHVFGYSRSPLTNTRRWCWISARSRLRIFLMSRCSTLRKCFQEILVP